MLTNSSATSTSITIQWDDVECIDQNSDIMGYNITIILDDKMMNFCSDEKQFTATGLFPSTMHTLQVAARSVNGTGPYSNITTSTTQPEGI